VSGPPDTEAGGGDTEATHLLVLSGRAA